MASRIPARTVRHDDFATGREDTMDYHDDARPDPSQVEDRARWWRGRQARAGGGGAGPRYRTGDARCCDTFATNELG